MKEKITLNTLFDKNKQNNHMQTVERTLAIIKPDGVKNADKII